MARSTQWLVLLLGLFGLTCSAHAQSAPPIPDPASVVVLANRAVEGSEKVARAYLKRRGIPEKNLILLRASDRERISRAEYIETIHNPVIRTLLKRRLIDAMENRADAFGRETPIVLKNPLRYLVLCYGMPLLVQSEGDQRPDDLALRERQLVGQYSVLVETFSSGPMAKDEATVDGELALLLIRDAPINGFFPNPHYRNQQLNAAPDVLRVNRIDGPTPESVIRMLDSALEGERSGLRGRAYIDLDKRGGSYQLGDDWLNAVANMARRTGYDTTVDDARATLPADSRFDAPVLYAGWYAENVNGPFLLPGFRFPAGAIAVHLHSFSARSMRDARHSWVAPFVDRGVAATVGNVTEPYLTLTHNFDLLFAALMSGWSFGDAAAFALPGLSWQAVAVGDPLFRPFARSLPDQLEAVGDPLQIFQDQYVSIREINLLMAADKPEAALQAAGRGMVRSPGPALGLRRAELLRAQGQPGKARDVLGFLSRMQPEGPGDWGLFAVIADHLREWGDADTALKIYQQLEAQPMPQPVQLAFLKRGIQAAQDAGRADIAIEWQARVEPPAPPQPQPQSPQPAPSSTTPVSSDTSTP